ncbi:MAG: hypothetical protein ACRD3B_14095 [Candidatus Sulfotelmatobacter sp.]
MPTKKKAKPKATSGPKASANAEFESTFKELKRVLGAFAPKLKVTDDEPHKYTLVTKSKNWRGQHMFFGALMQGKAYVSYHIMALYMDPELIKTVPPELKKRMQGKACFNFRSPDDVVFRQLKDVTQACLEKYRAKNWL